MKIVPTAILFAISLGSVNTSQIAKAEDKVSFKLQAIELESIEGMETMLGRMKSEAKLACAGRTFSRNYALQTATECREDIQTQWIEAIGSPALEAHMLKNNVDVASASQ
jgi:UrcA family protein